MGLVTSCCGRRPNKSRLHSYNERAAYKKGKRMVSASYNAQEFDMSFNLMNINEASEEELMTLQGVTRNIARNIISYRNHIGGFRKPEDLVLVSGIGATKLEAFRTEVYCGPYAVMPSTVTHRVSSRTSYHKSNSRNSIEKKIDINVASVPALAKIASIGHDLAEMIVKYREENGPFRLLTDVGKIPEVGSYRFELMRNHLTLDESSESTASTSSFLEMRRPLHSDEDESCEPSRFVGVSQLRAPVTQSTQTDEIFLPLIMTSMKAWARPVVNLPSEAVADGRSRIRIGTWNLQQFTKEKAENLGVKEVICMTVLENRLSVLAVQELTDRDALAVICSELNDPTLAVVRNWPTPRGIWKCVTSSEPAGRMFQGVEYNGFLWNTSDEVSLAESTLLQSPKQGTNGRHFVRKPFLGYFKAQELDLVLISVHLKFRGLANGSLVKLEEEIGQLSVLGEALKEQLPDEKDVLIMGDFNSSPSAPEFKALSAAGFSHALAEDTYTNISTKNLAGSHCYDNAWFSRSLCKIHTGESHVVREGLTHPLIPDNWSWGGVASDHCPVWVEFYSECDLDEGFLAQLSKVRLLPQE